MKLRDWQQHLKDTKRYSGGVDGVDGLLTEGATLLALTDGPDTALTDTDFADAGKTLEIHPAAIKAFWRTEANGYGFAAGRPKILPEPHRFSKNTGHIFDASSPALSYPKWGTRPYPPSQDARYQMLLQWIRLLVAKGMDIDAAFASASYGAPQIMGEHFKCCGYDSAPAFAEAMARDESTQLKAFMAFVDAAGILPALRKVDRSVASWSSIAERYNGTAYRVNSYDQKMAAAYAAAGGQ